MTFSMFGDDWYTRATCMFVIIPVWIISYPFVYWRQREKDQVRHGQRPPENNKNYFRAPFDISKRLPLIDDLSVIDMQTQSPLMRLPPEIREMIWEYCLTKHKHIVLELAKEIPRLPAADAMADTDSFFHLTPLQAQRRAFQNKLGALLRTCRAVYLETHHGLYSCNAFALKQLITVAYIGEYIPPSAVESIRTLKIQIKWALPPRFQSQSRNFRYLNEQWERFLDSLASMKRLRKLYLEIWLEPRTRSYWVEQEPLVFKRLSKIVLPEPWTLRVAWEENREFGHTYSNLPFRVLRISRNELPIDFEYMQLPSDFDFVHM